MPIFAIFCQKKSFFSARGARGGGPRGSPPTAAAKLRGPEIWNSTFCLTPRQIRNSNSHNPLPTYGIPVPIHPLHFRNSNSHTTPPLLEFHYSYIAPIYGIPAIFPTTLHASSQSCLHSPKIPHSY